MNTLRTCLLAVILAFLAQSPARAVDRTWDGDAGDNQWGTAANWSGNTMPVAGDRAIIVTNGLAAANSRIYLGANRTINELRFAGANNNVIVDGEGLYTLRLNTGLATGLGYPNPVTKGVIACDVVLGANGSWYPADAYGSWVYAYGAVTDEGNGYNMTFGDNQNRNVVVGGPWNIGGTIRIQNLNTRLGAVYTNSLGTALYGGSVTNAAAVYLDCRLGYSDNVDTLLTIENLYQADSDRIQGNIPLVIQRNGGALTFNGNAASAVSERIETLDLQGGRLLLTVAGRTAGVATDLTFGSVPRASGTSILVTTNGTGRLLVDGATNVNGTWQPWCFFGSLYSKVGPDSTIAATPTSDYLTPAATGNDATKLYQFAAASLALGETSSMWGLRWSSSSAQTLDLDAYDLTIGSGAMSVAGSLGKRITSSGGKLVFGGEDVIFYVDGSGTFTNSAPLAWSKPVGSSYTRPSLVFIRGSRTDGIVFDGQDLIGDYDSFYAQTYNSARRKITLGGPSDRTFYGPIVGVCDLEKTGAGSLTFVGPNNRRSGGLTVKEGRVILAHASAPTPTVTNAICEVAAGISIAATPVIQAGATMAGLGTFAAAVYPVSGIRIAPGSATIPGGLVFGSHLSLTNNPVTAIAFDIRIAATTNDNLRVVGNFTKPASDSTMTFRVSDASNGAAQINGKSFVVVRWGGTFVNGATDVSYVVENGTPNLLDTTDAVVTLDGTAKTITITGLRSVPKGTTILVR
jgi:autotransporter-associated beta strand protein